jgi:hypothetical protein
VTKCLELPAEMMRTNASLHADQARWHVGKSRVHLATRPLLPQHDRPALIKANNVERVLTNIDAHYDDHGVQYLRHGVLLVFGAYCQLRSLAGQEHGRTIPLAVNDGRSQWFPYKCTKQMSLVA